MGDSWVEGYLLDRFIPLHQWREWLNTDEALEWLYKVARTEERENGLKEGAINRAEIVDWEINDKGLVYLAWVRFHVE